MNEEMQENLDRAQQAYERMQGFRSDAQFRDEFEEKQLRMQQAMVEMLEGIYQQNEVMLKLLQRQQGS
jgi:hypothetical protein